jgi:hypothetical protein
MKENMGKGRKFRQKKAGGYKSKQWYDDRIPEQHQELT